ncbi:hypothetical protein BDA96_07G225300 [Sorghum bicolor]|uniref:Uncharacterized protein n=1 Tax=Sorghum bicolor TaxID=4558 RepID=A0A921QPE4_SORBI|nr:hypothetical protein BDA96_07G225300 [Sorghum bicolor]
MTAKPTIHACVVVCCTVALWLDGLAHQQLLADWRKRLYSRLELAKGAPHQ